MRKTLFLTLIVFVALFSITKINEARAAAESANAFIRLNGSLNPISVTCGTQITVTLYCVSLPSSQTAEGFGDWEVGPFFIPALQSGTYPLDVVINDPNKTYVFHGSCESIGAYGEDTDTNAATCTGAVAGTPTPTPTATATPTPGQPGVDLRVNGQNSVEIPYGTSANLTWNSWNTTHCTASWTQSQLGTSGSASTGNLTSTTVYTATCTGSGGSASDSVTVTVGAQPPAPPPSAPTVSGTPGCSYSNYSGSFSWTGDPNSGFYVDIGTDPNFAPYTFYNKSVGSSTSTDSSGFVRYPDGQPFGGLQPGTTYYVRVFNGEHSSTTSFYVPTCATVTTFLPSCASFTYTAGFEWTGDPDPGFGYKVNIGTDPNFAPYTFYEKHVQYGSGTDSNGFFRWPDLTTPFGGLQPGTTYYVRVFNGGFGSVTQFRTPWCGTLTGRVVDDRNGNVTYEAGTDFLVRHPDGQVCNQGEVTPSSWTIDYVNTGTSSTGSINGTACNPESYFAVGLPPGNYNFTFVPPSGWTVVTPNPKNVTITEQGVHQEWFFGIQPPSDVSAVLSCTGGDYVYTFSWTGAPNPTFGFYLDIDDGDSNFGSYYNKNVPSGNSTDGSNLKGIWPSTSQTLVFDPGTYYVRAYNGGHSGTSTLSVPTGGCNGWYVGRIWKDDNANQSWEAGESATNYWTLQIPPEYQADDCTVPGPPVYGRETYNVNLHLVRNSDGYTADTTATYCNGLPYFSAYIPAGQYTVTVQLPTSDWETVSPSSYQIVVSPDEVTDQWLYVRPKPGGLFGRIVKDNNGNLTLDAGDVIIKYWSLPEIYQPCEGSGYTSETYNVNLHLEKVGGGYTADSQAVLCDGIPWYYTDRILPEGEYDVTVQLPTEGWEVLSANPTRVTISRASDTSQYFYIRSLNGSPSVSVSSIVPPDYCLLPPSMTVLWSYSDPDSQPQSAYDVQIDDSPTFDSPHAHTGKVASAVAAYTSTGLAFNTTYYARVMVWDSIDERSEWSSSATFTTPIHAYPDASFTYSPTAPLAGDEVQFTDTSTAQGGASIVAWSWTFEDGTPATSTQQNPVSVFSTGGNKSVTLTATDSDGYACQDTQTVNSKRSSPIWKEIAPFLFN